jgi:signal transduction histidine kinase
MIWSIERKLPLLVTGLLLAVAGAQLAIGFGEVRQASRTLVDKRLPLAGKVLADAFQLGQTRTRVTALANNPAVVEYLRSRGERGREPALRAMRSIATDTATNLGLELRDFSGRLLLRSGRFVIADSVLVSPGTDSARYGSLLRRDTTLYFAIAAATGGGAETSGGIVQLVARLQLNERTKKTLTGLAGGDISLLLGNATGDPWTDFATVVPAPPESVRTSRTPVRYLRGEMQRASAAPVPGTPWMVVAEIPNRLVAAPARAYLVSIAPIALFIVALGALVAWWGSRRMIRPLGDMTRAAEAIATGDLGPRVAIGGDDELGRLARSFNTMADQVSRSQHELEEKVAERTSDLESFTYSVSHDLRAPLRAIHGFSRILLEDHHTRMDPEAQRLLGVIDQNTRHMGQLIDDLLAFSRLGRQAISAERIDFNELTHSVVEEIQRTEGSRNGHFEITIDQLRPAHGDPALLRQVISNLLQNAVKFTRGRPQARIEVGSRPEGHETIYSVRDNGAGFDPRYTDKLFGVFQRLHSTEDFEGTGVGLAIVRRIVQRHGGRVWAEGKVNEGATFYFSLPRTGADA